MIIVKTYSVAHISSGQINSAVERKKVMSVWRSLFWTPDRIHTTLLHHQFRICIEYKCLSQKLLILEKIVFFFVIIQIMLNGWICMWTLSKISCRNEWFIQNYTFKYENGLFARVVSTCAWAELGWGCFYIQLAPNSSGQPWNKHLNSTI